MVCSQQRLHGAGTSPPFLSMRPLGAALSPSKVVTGGLIEEASLSHPQFSSMSCLEKRLTLWPSCLEVYDWKIYMKETGSVCSNWAQDLRSWGRYRGRGELFALAHRIWWEPCRRAGGLTQSVPLAQLHWRKVHLSSGNQEAELITSKLPKHSASLYSHMTWYYLKEQWSTPCS